MAKKWSQKVYVLPHELDVEIAKLKLNSMGYDLDSLTQEQIDYLTKSKLKIEWKYNSKMIGLRYIITTINFRINNYNRAIMARLYL